MSGAGPRPGSGRKPSRGLARVPRALAPALLLAAAALLVLPDRAHAQTAYVSNTGVASTVDSFGVHSTAWQGQQFSTGSQAGGYPLGGVGIIFKDDKTNLSGLVVRIYSESGGKPDSVLYTLTNPDSLTAGTEALFTAPANANLDPDKEFFVVVEPTGGFSNTWMTATSDAEDSGATTGWSILNVHHFRAGSAGSWNNGTGAPLAMAVYPPRSPNAVGNPTISGTAQVGQTLMAEIGTIADADGLTDSTFPDDYSFQWVRVDGAAETDISEATEGTYDPVADDVGKTLKVKVSFTDDDGTSEGPLESVETEAVTAAPAQEGCPADATWCGTMTVVASDESTAILRVQTSGYSAEDDTGSLSPTTFTHGGADYTVTRVWRNKITTLATSVVEIDNLSLTVTDGELPDGTLLKVDGRTAALTVGTDSATTIPGEEQWDLRILGNAPEWTDGQMVTVSLTLPAASEAKLSGLALENASDDSAITLTPAFTSGTTGYTASVGNGVGQVTVKPTLSNDTATIAWLGAGGTAIPDADSMKDDQQVALDVGSNAIRVKVTAEDGVTTETYTLTVTRGPPLWTTRMIIGEESGARGFSRAGTNDVGSLDDETFEYPSLTRRVTAVLASSIGVQFRVRSGATDFGGLVLEWAGEVLPLDEATRGGQVFTWSQSWLGTNASSLASASYATTLPDGGRGIVCLRAANETCPSTAIGENSPATGAPAISGAAQAGQTLTASLGTVVDADGVPSTLTWQWVRVASGEAEAEVGANAATYTPTAADVGSTIRVKVSFTDNLGFSEGPLASAATAAVLAAPAACPANSDWCATLTVGVVNSPPITLTAGYIVFGSTTLGGLSDATIGYGDTSYTVLSLGIAEEGGNDLIAIGLDAFVPQGAVFNLGGTEFTANAASEQTTAGAYQWPLPANFAWREGQKVTVSVRFPSRAATGAPTISGTAAVGETLTAGLGDIADEDGATAVFPDDYGFQWVRVSGSNETDISGATGRTYTVQSADRGKKVKVKVSFTDDRGYGETRKSDAHPETGNVAAAGSVPSVLLVKNLDQTTSGQHSTVNTIAQQFTTGSHGRGYQLGRVKIKSNSRDRFTLKVCSTNASGDPTSTCTSLTAPGSFGGGVGTRTLTFTAPAGTRLDAGTKYAVVVSRSGSLLYPYTTSNSEDSGKAAGWSIADHHHIQSGESWNTNSSGRSLLIAIEGSPAPNQVATGKPAVSGEAVVGQVLTAGIGTIADADGLPSIFPDDYDFQWLRVVDGTATQIPGATSGTYTLKLADAGAKVRVQASFTGGSAETVTSDAWPSTGTVVTMSTPSQGLVGNTGQTSIANVALDSQQYALGFRTGGRAAGYRLTSIKVGFGDVPSSADASRVRVELRKGASANATRLTNDTVAVLANPSNLASGAGVKTFTAPGGTRLVANTNYFLFISYSGSSSVSLSQTSSGNEDAGRAAGWNIANGRLRRTRGSLGIWASDASRVLKISVEGSILSNPAIGKPAISGVPQDGGRLMADTSGIVDPDGLPSAFTYRWVRVAPGGAETVVGSNATTYTLTSADVGSTIRVEVSFTDNAGNSEGPLASDATDPVVAAARACPADNFWCRIVTVEVGRAGVAVLVKSSDSLADRRFTHEGTTYTVSILAVHLLPSDNDSLLLYLDRFLPRGTVLHLGGREFVTNSASETLIAGEYAWHWPEGAVLYDGQRVRLALRAQENHAATGKPAVSGRARVGLTLAAGVGGISDANGLDDASFSYQWVRVDADGTSNPTDIGEDAPSYTLVAADEGKRIRVQVSLTDDLGLHEGPLESDAFPATGTVEAMSMPSIGTLVSNIGRSGDTGIITINNYGQQFTAGTAATLSGVDVVSDDDEGDEFSVSVCTITGAGHPSSTCTSLTAPSSFAKGTLSFTAPTGGIALTPNTKYSVLVNPDGTNTATAMTLSIVSSNAEDPGKPAGWSIANSFYRTAGTSLSNWSEDPSGRSLRVAIKGSLVNTAATGAPAITGVPQAGATLTADTSGIADVDGLDSVSYEYRWIRVAADATETVVALDTETYELTAADIGHSYKVEVGFDDDIGSYEALESAVVGPVVAAATACPGDAIWCRTVTVEGAEGEFGLIAESENSAGRQFSLGGTDYIVGSVLADLSETGGTLLFETNRRLPRGLALYVDGDAFALDAASQRPGSAHEWTLPAGYALHDGQRATVRIVPARDSVALSALVLESAADGAAVSLSPAFDLETTAYRARVVTDVSSITVSATAASDRATVAYLDAGNAPIADADGGKDGLQVALMGGANTIRVRVTAEDGVTTRTYAVTVTRMPWRWTTVAEIGRAGNGTRGFSRFMGDNLGSLTDEDFEYASGTWTVTLLRAGSNGVQFQAGTGGRRFGDLVLEWAGEVLPFADALFSGNLFTWGQSWLDANASALAAANFAATLPEGRRGTVCLRTAAASCPSTRLAANSLATGAPSVSGTPQVGETLTASTRGIRDGNGLDKVSWSYQWVRVEGGTETEISGANAETYTPRAADEGKQVQVKVTFTDDLGYPEGALVSAAYPSSGSILPPRAACPADATWCSVITVGAKTNAGIRYSGFSRGTVDAGTIDDGTIDVGRRAIEVAGMSLVAGGGVDAVELRTGDVELPRGTVFNLDGTEFTLDAGSHQGGTADRWTRPAGLAWARGRKVTVSLKFPAWTRNKRLGALTLENASDGTAIAIDPSFSPGKGTYTAVVPSGVDKVTVAAAAEESRSTVSFHGTRGSFAAQLDDADDVIDGHQVALWEGNSDNTLFNVMVTAWDRSSRRYHVVVRSVDSATLPDLVLTYVGRMDGGGVTMAILGTSTNGPTRPKGFTIPRIEGTETRSRCVGRSFTLWGSDGTPKPNVAWSLEPWVRNDGLVVEGNRMFTIGSDGQIRTVVGVDYPARGGLGSTRLRVRGTDLDSDGSVAADVSIVMLHPEGYDTDAGHGNYCANRGLTVADAEAVEGAGATLDFKVSLRPAARQTVTVDYATSDGTATAGDDYTATSDTLTFAPGETAAYSTNILIQSHILAGVKGSDCFRYLIDGKTLSAFGTRIGAGDLRPPPVGGSGAH